MSKTRKHDKVTPPPLGEDGNPIVGEDGVNTETSTTPTLEELMRRLEELTTENKKLRAKAKNKKTKENSSSSEEDSSFKDDVFKKEKKGRRNHDKSSYNSMTFNYNNMRSSTAYTCIPVGKAPYFDKISYN
jgi:predicted RNase H-like nuclease (RuvC/YqgF family)